MKSAVVTINKVLDATLKREILEEMAEKGELPKTALRSKSEGFWQVFFELVELCGLRVERELERNLHNGEILFMAERIERFLKVVLIS